MIRIERTDFRNPDFISLVRLLDADLAQRDGADHSFYSQFNKVDGLRHVVVAYDGGSAVGCGAIKEFSSEAMEVKRMYVLPEWRSRKIASQILAELERWAASLSYVKCVLETGKRQPEAIAFYEKNGYYRIQNYGQYAGIDNSLCFEKPLS